jgi:signal transduction histidine kinase
VRSRASVACRAIVATTAVAFGISSVTLAGTIPGDTPYDTTYGSVSPSLVVLEAAVGLGLLGAALLLLAERFTAVPGALTACLSVVWFAPVWIGWEAGPDAVRALALVVAPFLPTLVLALVVCLPRTRTGRLRTSLIGLVALAVAATAVSSIGLTLVRDPIRELACWRDCTVHALVVDDDVHLASRFISLVLFVGAACGAIAVTVALGRLLRASAVTRRASGPAFAAVAVAGTVLALSALVLRLGPPEDPARPLYVSLFVARGLGLLAVAAALVWLALRPRLVRSLVSRLAVDLERSAVEGGLGRVLARTLHDPELVLGYPVGSTERIVDGEGRPMTLNAHRRITPVVGDDGVVACVESDVADLAVLERELGPAAHLALDNERLRAEALARLADLTESRARIVESADRARQRMERDLHDGAQQRMLALSFDLQVAATVAESSGSKRAAEPLRAALDRVVAATQELRDVAHGIFPAELSVSGLGPALESLADVQPLRLLVELPDGRRYPPDIENAVYAVVVEALDAGSGPVRVSVGEEGDLLRLAVEGIPDWGERLVLVEDRVSAVGGEVELADGRLDVTLPHR